MVEDGRSARYQMADNLAKSAIAELKRLAVGRYENVPLKTLYSHPFIVREARNLVFARRVMRECSQEGNSTNV